MVHNPSQNTKMPFRSIRLILHMMPPCLPPQMCWITNSLVLFNSDQQFKKLGNLGVINWSVHGQKRRKEHSRSKLVHYFTLWEKWSHKLNQSGKRFSTTKKRKRKKNKPFPLLPICLHNIKSSTKQGNHQWITLNLITVFSALNLGFYYLR